MKDVIQAMSRATMMMLTPRIWGLVWRPALFSLLGWFVIGGVLWWGFGDDIFVWLTALKNRWALSDAWMAQAMNWAMQGGFWLAVGLLWILLVVLSSMLMISVFGMTHINRAVADKFFPTLQSKGGLSTWLSLRNTMRWTFWFAFFWIISTPAYLFAGLGAVIQTGVMARYNQKVFAFDALADYADTNEYAAIANERNVHLFILGVLITLMGALPTFIWMGSIIGVILLPFAAIFSVLTFTALFTFCGLTYSCYCLQALSDYRMRQREHLLQTVLQD
ncbi:EI24 domain-containing protein [Hydromonas duriensis]|uniref:Etoposide-induced protein 2.4 (EI24) n=1 Tax=Hydromonas duriensis TaxID=1527608 RepID=A0A4R6YB86_9BURK|nr:EI24 domain-containing protein [Hydromonas duriensis]TDR32816.1 etoposide-induced protein 2.4 (EI24) [Hydromonas duriensis]